MPPPLGMAEQVWFTPLSAAKLRPDLVVFLGKPGSLHRLLTLASYWEGGPLETDLAGPACRTGITFPLMTGQPGMSLVDFGARRLAAYPEDLLLLTFPMHRMLGIMAALDDRRGNRGADLPEGEFVDLGPLQKV